MTDTDPNPDQYRIYRYDLSNLAAGEPLMTF